MDREDELNIRVELNKVIGQWWDDTTVSRPLIANGVIPLMADEVLILNVDGYIGESTRRELNYAIAQNKIVRYWETAVSEEE